MSKKGPGADAPAGAISRAPVTTGAGKAGSAGAGSARAGSTGVVADGGAGASGKPARAPRREPVPWSDEREAIFLETLGLRAGTDALIVSVAQLGRFGVSLPAATRTFTV